jgi:hypothetical protein
MIEVRRYTADKADEWNQFVATSKNGTFLFYRGYMDYHADRFLDFSLMFYENDKLCGLLPANRRDDTLYSHQGLTYGGLITTYANTTAQVCQFFAEMNAFLRNAGVRRVVYKPVPSVYHQLPAEEDLYALFVTCHARLLGRDVSSVILPANRIKWKRDRHYAANKARTNGIQIKQSNDFASFWQILSDNLRQKFSASPVHTLSEIELLHSRFPENICLWVAHSKESVLLAGTVLYLCGGVVRSQYISASPEGKQLHAVDGLYDYIIHHAYPDARYFDLGTSNMPHSSDLHDSLIYQKEGFGGRAVCFDTYEWTL